MHGYDSYPENVDAYNKHDWTIKQQTIFSESLNKTGLSIALKV